MTRFLLLTFLLAANLPAARAQVPERLQLPIGCGDTLPPVIVTGYARDRRSEMGCHDPYTIDTRDFTEVKRLPALGQATIQPLVSRVAGVQATPYSGAPGALAVVRIRGASGLAGNPQPLYVVDGVPVFQNMGATAGWAGPAGTDEPAELNPLLGLPPEDIESVTILKGPLETARYGTQGQNGVVSIVTKAGTFGQKLRVSYAGYGGVQQVRQRYALLDARQYGQLLNEAAANQGQPAAYSPAQLAALGPGTDWQSALLRTAAVQEHHLSLSGGRPNTRYYVAADYLRQNGIVLNSWLQRYALRANVEQRFSRLSPKLLLTAHLALAQTSARRALEDLTQHLLTARPTSAPYTADGQLSQPATAADNPVRQALEEVREPRQRQLLAGLALRYPLSPHLVASLLGHWEQNNLRQARHLPDYSSPARYADEQLDYRFRQLTLGGALDFARTLGERHDLTARLAAHWQDLYDDRATTLVNQAQSRLVTSTATQRTGLRSAALQAGYTYARRYEVQGSLWLDDHGWQPTYAGQASWHLQQEAWLQAVSQLHKLDLWVSAGRSANSGSFYALSQPTPALPSPPGLEKLHTQEVGLAVGWGSYFTADLVAYQRRATPLLAEGGPFPTVLTAEYQVRSRGLELSLGGTFTSHGFYSSTTLAAAWQQSRYESAYTYPLNLLGQRLADGQPLSAFQGLRYLGADATGRPRYQDASGDGTITPQDAQPLGTGLPRVLLSLAQDVDYKGWHLACQLDALLGYQVLNASLLRLDSPAGATNASTRMLDRWTPARPAAGVPGAGLGAPAPGSSYYLQAGSHARLASLRLSYKVRARSLHPFTLWLGGNNLVVLSGYRGFDPNVSSGGAAGTQAGLDASAYPVARTWLLGVRATL
jgi:TonB-dependent SusC/RagA subfamily outer membrane receptor